MNLGAFADDLRVPMGTNVAIPTVLRGGRSMATEDLILQGLCVGKADEMGRRASALDQQTLECMQPDCATLGPSAIIVSEAYQGLFAPDRDCEEVLLKLPSELQELN